MDCWIKIVLKPPFILRSHHNFELVGNSDGNKKKSNFSNQKKRYYHSRQIMIDVIIFSFFAKRGKLLLSPEVLELFWKFCDKIIFWVRSLIICIYKSS